MENTITEQQIIDYFNNLSGKQGEFIMLGDYIIQPIYYREDFKGSRNYDLESMEQEFTKTLEFISENMNSNNLRTLWKITEIEWDTDGEDIYELPTEEIVELDEDDDEDQIADILSDVYGWCINSYNAEQIYKHEE
jgi:hypothetical protein